MANDGDRLPDDVRFAVGESVIYIETGKVGKIIGQPVNRHQRKYLVEFDDYNGEKYNSLCWPDSLERFERDDSFYESRDQIDLRNSR